jgi:hypothetical protein
VLCSLGNVWIHLRDDRVRIYFANWQHNAGWAANLLCCATLAVCAVCGMQDDRVRIYFGNAGPNKLATFHIIGVTFDKV